MVKAHHAEQKSETNATIDTTSRFTIQSVYNKHSSVEIPFDEEYNSEVY